METQSLLSSTQFGSTHYKWWTSYKSKVIIGIAGLLVIMLIIYSIIAFHGNESILNYNKNSPDDDRKRVLITDNPNTEYLCAPDFLYHEFNANPSSYQFQCLYGDSYSGRKGGLLKCDNGYTLKCLVGASYGNTAGNCDEIETSSKGCGFAQNVICDTDYLCDDGVINQCLNTETNIMTSTITPCGDCIPLCRCNMKSPQFYNVADCFGDGTSSICGQNDIKDTKNVYLPFNIWKNYCKGKNKCNIGLTNTPIGTKKYQCYSESDDLYNTYFNAFIVNGEYIEKIADEEFEDVILNQYYNDCEYIKFKTLAVCEKR